MVHQMLRKVNKKHNSHITCKGSTLNKKMNNQNNSIPREYQVATPKSPTDLHRPDLTDVSPPSMIDTLTNDNDDDDLHTHSMIISNRDSEDIERLKYETAKNELLDKLNLHILLSFKKSDKIKRELSRVHAQMKIMNKLHDDKELLNKIEKYNQIKLNQNKDRLLNRNHSVTFVENSMSPNLHGHTPNHHYHTRSKSQGNLSDDSFWKDCIDDPILTSRTNRKINPSDKHFYSNKLNNIEQQINSNIATPDYMIQIGTNRNPKCYNNNPIFKRKDRIFVLLTCSVCGRQGFMTVKGIASHIKIKHDKTYETPKLAVLMNQWLLPDEWQDSLILTKFNDLNLDPKLTYLPSINDDKQNKKNNNVAKKPITKGLTQLTRSTSHSHTTKNQSHTIPTYQSNEENYNINHLQNFCNKDELTSLIDMVKTSKQDLDVILQQQSESENDSESEREEEELQIDVKTPDSVNDADYETPNSPLSSNCNSPVDDISMENSPSVSKSSSPPITTIPLRRMNLRKRKQEAIDDNDSIPLKERLRPSEKKPRPDVIALSDLPEHERRSKHYNLRARSKLRSSSVEEDL